MNRIQFLIIVVLLVLNLLATLSLSSRNDSAIQASEPIAEANSAELPAVITDAVRVSLLDEFTDAFNRDDYEAVYDMFSPAAKARIDKDDIVKELEKLKKAFHSISGGAYSHFEFVRSMGGADVYVLYYNVRISQLSDFGPAGDLKITLAVQGSRFQVYGIRLSSQ